MLAHYTLTHQLLVSFKQRCHTATWPLPTQPESMIELSAKIRESFESKNPYEIDDLSLMHVAEELFLSNDYDDLDGYARVLVASSVLEGVSLGIELNKLPFNSIGYIVKILFSHFGFINEEGWNIISHILLNCSNNLRRHGSINPELCILKFAQYASVFWSKRNAVPDVGIVAADWLNSTAEEIHSVICSDVEILKDDDEYVAIMAILAVGIYKGHFSQVRYILERMK